jgi:hypothetical protein
VGAPSSPPFRTEEDRFRHPQVEERRLGSSGLFLVRCRAFRHWGNPQVAGGLRKRSCQDVHRAVMESRNPFVLTYYTVFNVEQCDGLKLVEPS